MALPVTIFQLGDTPTGSHYTLSDVEGSSTTTLMRGTAGGFGDPAMIVWRPHDHDAAVDAVHKIFSNKGTKENIVTRGIANLKATKLAASSSQPAVTASRKELIDAVVGARVQSELSHLDDAQLTLAATVAVFFFATPTDPVCNRSGTSIMTVSLTTTTVTLV